jgi:site-specific recombinase XerD
MTEAGVRKTLAWIDEAAGFQWLVHPHQLRHGCGYKLLNDARDTRALQHYLRHRNIQHPTRYTQCRAMATHSEAIAIQIEMMLRSNPQFAR